MLLLLVKVWLEDVPLMISVLDPKLKHSELYQQTGNEGSQSGLGTASQEAPADESMSTRLLDLAGLNMRSCAGCGLWLLYLKLISNYLLEHYDP